MNAFEDADGRVHPDMHQSDTSALPFIRAASGIARNAWEIGGGLARWSFDLNSDASDAMLRPLGPPGGMPRVADADQGRLDRAGWSLSINPASGPPLVGGPVGTCFNLLFRIEPATGQLGAIGLPPGHAVNEPVRVLAAATDHKGWFLPVADRELGDDAYAHDLWVIDVSAVAAGPVAKVHLPGRMGPQVHGWWAPAQG